MKRVCAVNIGAQLLYFFQVYTQANKKLFT